jgi:dolichol-phosphate mannosyltransferase
MKEKKLVSIVCPCFNEEPVIDQFYQELRRVLDQECPPLKYQIYFIDDGSQDATLEHLNSLAERDPGVRVYSLSRNFGHQIALSAGIDVARGDALVLMDSDLQHPPQLLPLMIQKWQEGFQVVSALRQQTAGASWLKSVTSDGFYTLFNFLSEVPLVPGVADFTLLSREAYLALRRMPERHRFLRGMISWMGFRRACVPYVAPPRRAGLSKYTWRRMLSLAADALCSFTARPIRLATRFGLLVALLGFCYLGYILLHALLFQDAVPGWASILSTVIILGGVQLFFIGLIGGYVARIFEEAKARPLYFFKQIPHRPRRRPAFEKTAEVERGTEKHARD